MKTNHLRRSCLCIALLIAMSWEIEGVSADQPRAAAHSTALTARVAFPDGTTQVLTVDGFGCSVALCSKVFIRAKGSNGATENMWIDTIAEIKDIADDGALFVMKDGTARRLSFVSDFRVLYFRERNNSAKKLDLAKIRSLQMVAASK